MRTGRPLALTQEIVDGIADFAQIGMTWKDVATFAGVTYRTVRSWCARGEKELERRTAGEKPREKNDIYVHFLHATKKARLKSKYGCMQKILEIGYGGQVKDPDKTYANWQALAWLLERQYPDEFALASRTKLAELAEQLKQMQKG